MRRTRNQFVDLIPPWHPVDRPKKRAIRVGVVLDRFSERAFAPEWDQINLSPKSWRADIETFCPQIIFVESAWHGYNGDWSGGLAGKHLSTLDELVRYCKTRGIPTVFWNKEDPAHFEEFFAAARLFDYIFTTDINMVDRYRAGVQHENVYVLPFGAQPSLHNPLRVNGTQPDRDIMFAGTYFRHKFPERREQMDMLLTAALRASKDMEHGLDIYSRFLGKDDRYQFPTPLSNRIVGSVDYDRMISAYHLYKVALNVNSVVESRTMCSRRIFELLASGVAVVSTHSDAVVEFFPTNEVTVVDNDASAEFALRSLVRNPVLRDRMVHLAQRRIWREHTYGKRVDFVLDKVGIPEDVSKRPLVSVLVSTNRPNQVDHIVRTIDSMNGVNGIKVQLCFLAHGFTVADSLVEQVSALGLENAVFLHEASSTPLGACYNRLAAVAEGDVVAKIDDDDLYGPHYLSDQVYALGYSGADVVGKQAHYTWFESTNCTSIVSPEREHKLTHFVAGPTIVTWRKTLLETPFRTVSRGEDTKFLQDVIDAGGTIYSADRYNFVRVRGNHGHTWALSDWEMLAKSDVVVNGCPKDQIFF
nr:glycosyltransferase [Corynebacterium meridianum]